jgi:hypothetical protein
VLERYPNANLRVYVVWMPMLVTDSRGAWSSKLLADPRVRHYWDGERKFGTFLARENAGGLGYAGVVWDAYFLFGPDALWLSMPAPVMASGSDVIDHTAALQRALPRLLR